MNCKPGELAIRVRAPEYALIQPGDIVRVAYWVGSDFTQSGALRHNLWCVEFRGSARSGDGATWVVPYDELRPLRDDPGTDEMLRIAGLPLDHKQPQEA